MLKRRSSIIIILLICLLFSSCKNEEAENTTSEGITTSVVGEETTHDEVETTQNTKKEQAVLNFIEDKTIVAEYKYKAVVASNAPIKEKECTFVFKQTVETDSAYVIWEAYDMNGEILCGGSTQDTINWQCAYFNDFEVKDVNDDGSTDFLLKISDSEEDINYSEKKQGTLLFLNDGSGNNWYFETICDEDTIMEKPDESQNTEEQDEDSYLYLDPDFWMKIKDNPIDKVYDNMDFSLSTTDGIEQINEIRDYWLEEIEYTYEQLYNVLDDEDKKTLEETQLLWEELCVSKDKLQKKFYYYNKYFTAGTIYKLLLNDLQMENVRNRALELKEYYYSITGEISFKYNN